MVLVDSVLTFVDKARKYFGFLESELGFKIIAASSNDLRPQTDGVVKYASNVTLIVIDSDLSQSAIRFVRIQDDEKYCLDPASIHEYLNTSENEKRLLLSTEPSNQLAASALRRERLISSAPHWKGTTGNASQDLETQLKNYADWLRKNADLCLSGDLSRWPELYEYKINRMIADELRRGGSAFVKAVVRDESGKLKMIEQPIFQVQKDHLEKIEARNTGPVTSPEEIP
jgi:hypothetical protein